MASLPPAWFEVELWGARCIEGGLNTWPSYSDALPTKIHTVALYHKNIEERGSNTWPSYIQCDAFPTKIEMQQHCGSNILPVSALSRERSVDGTHDLHVSSVTFSQQIYRSNNVVDPTHDPLPTKIQIQRQQHCGLKTRPSYIQSDLWWNIFI